MLRTEQDVAKFGVMEGPQRVFDLFGFDDFQLLVGDIGGGDRELYRGKVAVFVDVDAGEEC